jgi:hypothetical protein
MDKPAWFNLSESETQAGCKWVRFLDHFVLLNKQFRAVRRVFFPSRNAAKKNNRLVLSRLPYLRANPRNAESCTNQMVHDTTPIKESKGQRRLSQRIADFSRMTARARHDEWRGYTKPGSVK